MKYDVQSLVSDLKDGALPMAEKDAIVVVDIVLKNLKKQADGQVGDPVAGFCSIAVPIVQPMIDAELAKALPAAASV